MEDLYDDNGVLILTLENGNKIKLQRNDKVMTKNRGEVLVKDLVEGDEFCE